MSRFPSVPGAGAKRINNPVYWVRRAIQDDGYRKTSQAAEERWQERYKRLWEIYNHCWDNYYEDVKDYLTEKEFDKFGDLNDKFKMMNKEIDDHPYLRTGDLNKLSTRLKNFTLFVFNKCIEHEIYNNLSTVAYEAKGKMIKVDGEDYYFLGSA